jgi:hypothetical protein
MAGISAWYPASPSYSAVSTVIWSLDLEKWAGLARMRGRLGPSNNAKIPAAGFVSRGIGLFSVNLRGHSQHKRIIAACSERLRP